MRLAIVPRIPVIRRISLGALVSRSSIMMRPSGPEPTMVLRSMPFSIATRRIFGDMRMRPSLGAGAEATGACAVGAATGAAACAAGAGVVDV